MFPYSTEREQQQNNQYPNGGVSSSFSVLKIDQQTFPRIGIIVFFPIRRSCCFAFCGNDVFFFINQEWEGCLEKILAIENDKEIRTRMSWAFRRPLFILKLMSTLISVRRSVNLIIGTVAPLMICIASSVQIRWRQNAWRKTLITPSNSCVSHRRPSFEWIIKSISLEKKRKPIHRHWSFPSDKPRW